VYLNAIIFTKYKYHYQTKEGEMGRECNTQEEKRNIWRVLEEKPEGN
jgi:hypothetical protein